MAFKLENFGAEVANAKSTLGGICYYRYFNEDNNTLTTAGYFPATLGLEVGDRIRVIPSVKTNADEIYIVTNTDNRTVVVKQIDTDGAVDSVNGKTGNVTITADDVLPTQTDNSGKFLTTNGTSSSWASVDALPSQTSQSGKFLTTDGTDASWASVSEVPATTGATAGDVLTLDSSSNPVWQTPAGGLPDQTGQSGKFLTTDGTDASWSDKPLVNNSTNSQGLVVSNITSGTVTTGSRVTLFGKNGNTTKTSGTDNSCFGFNITPGGDGCCIFGSSGYINERIGQSVAIGYNSTVTAVWNTNNSLRNIAIGAYAKVGEPTSSTISYAIQLGTGTNTESGTFCVGLYYNNASVNYKLLDSDGTIPAARHASLPAADGTYVLKLVISGGVPTLSWVAE